MSDINHNRMIPLHIADQAVAACEKEIAALKAEVERLTKAHSDALADFWAIHKGYFDLKAEVERMTAEVNYRKNMDTHIKIMADQYTPAKEGKPSA